MISLHPFVRQAVPFFSLCVAVSVGIGIATPAWAEQGRTAQVLSHELAVELTPDKHQLLATDRMVLSVEAADLRELSFLLSASLHADQVQVVTEGGEPATLPFTTGVKPASEAHKPSEQQIEVSLPASLVAKQRLTLLWRYHGTINDPPREPRHLRFVTPSETAGHIGPEGVYLSGETQWYPDHAGSLATFRLQVAVPHGWSVVTHGKEMSRRESGEDGRRVVTSEWNVAAKTEALTLVANKFVPARREWRSKTGQQVDLETFLFPEDAHLSDEYLDASARYLEAYIALLGPYPYAKFAVVENFFASGLGMPSFTLLGSSVIKRHYVQPYALGHEIVHSWIGNSVFNRTDQGNWVEGLTTYLANYYYHELSGSLEQARDQRRLMLYGYAVHVRAEQDYPVGSFTRKTDEKDNAIGYQKSAMIFHLLRQEIGETAFWAGLRTLVADFQETYASWTDLARTFAKVSGRDLRWFFAQWVERAGAPRVRMAEVRAVPAPGTADTSDGFTMTVRLQQEGTPFRIPVQLSVTLANGQKQGVRVSLDGQEREVTVPVPSRPATVQLDPDFHLFRTISRAHLPPMLNLYVTDEPRTVIVPTGGPAPDRIPYEELAQRVHAQEATRSAREKTVIMAAENDRASLPIGSVLVLGSPAINPATKIVEQVCGNRLRLSERGFSVGGVEYDGPGLALLASCHRPEKRGHVTTLFYGATPEAASKVARLLFFYGWQSYVVFRDGAAVARGDWDTKADMTEVQIDGR